MGLERIWAHTESMKRWLVPALVAAVVLALGVFAAVSSKESGDSDDAKNSASQGRKHSNDKDKGKPDKAAREEWRQLTPAQRRALIDRLITEHAEGMKEWRDCVLAERDDCEMPFPPGLARRR